ncbi:MAG: helix-hairpin-helix domain-containing protein, partial [Methanoregula sp.]|nr:helix-hairpin-helix domain-containing protein [Methanoregula sp.]
ATVNRHIALVCEYLHRPVPGKVPAKPGKTAAAASPKKQKIRKELLAIKGITAAVAEALAKAGIVTADNLLKADAKELAAQCGIDRSLIADFQKQIQKKREVIQI